MEKRDMIVIIVAIFIVLIMAMYIKPLVTGKEAKLIPDEISGLFAPKNETEQVSANNTSANYSSNLSDELTNTSSEYLLNSNLTNGLNNTTSEGLPDSNLTNGANLTNQTNRRITPIPTQWDGKKISVESNLLSPTPTPTRVSVFTAPEIEIISPELILFTEFKGTQPQIFGPIVIPTGYWDIVYTVDFKTNLANPESDNIFEFNKQYKEALISYEVGPNNKEIDVIYNKDGKAIGMDLTKSENISDIIFIQSKDKILIKTPKEGDWEAGKNKNELPYDVSEATAPYSLVESVSYGLPDITLVVKNLDDLNKPDIIIKPNGGIDPLQWKEDLHKKKAEDDLKQKGKSDLLSSALYQKEWEKKWKDTKDPRPWKERIYGYGNYKITVYPNNIESYKVDVLVPVIKNQSDADK